MSLGFLSFPSFITAFVGLITLAVLVYKLPFASKSRLKDDYRFAKEFLEDIVSDKDMHHLVVERGYFALVGKSGVKVEDIEYIISLVDADRCLKDYLLARTFIEFDVRIQKIVFKGVCKSKRIRSILKVLLFLVYFIMGNLAVAPYIFAYKFDFSLQWFALSVVAFLCFGFFAVRSLLAFIRIQRGEELVKGQRKCRPLVKGDR